MNTTILRAARAPRALVSSVRADLSDPKIILTELQKSFADFKAQNDKVVDDLKAKVDPLDAQKITAMGTSILDLQAAFDKQAIDIAAASIGHNGGSWLEDPDYSAKFEAVFRGDASAAPELKAMQKTGKLRAALSEGVPANGGFVTPIEWDRTITEKLKLISPIRREATVQPISTIGFSKLYTDRVVGSGWVGETAARPLTATPGLQSLVFGVGEIYANPAASQDLLDDALIDARAWLANEVDVEFARQEGIAFISGTGMIMPDGLLTYVTGGTNATKHPFGAIPVTPSGAANGYTADALIAAIYALPAMWQPNAKFYTNRMSLLKVMQLKNTQGTYYWQPSLVAGQPSTLMGAPVIDIPDMPAVATNNIAMLYGDMRATYLILDRMGVRVLPDPYTNKPFVTFHTTKRVGGGVNQPQAMVAVQVA